MLIDKDRRPVAAQLVQQIQRLIAEHGLKPGDKVPAQRELAASFGASRPTVREAVLQLEAMGLIRVEPARGAFVTEAFGRPAVDVSEWSFAERFSQPRSTSSASPWKDAPSVWRRGTPQITTSSG